MDGSGNFPDEDGSISRRTRQRGPKKSVDPITKEFLQNFDPEQSEREKRKLNRRLTHGNKKLYVYDENGLLIANKMDLCDCLQVDCPGCHFPCPKCTSKKCGHECRVNRKWSYEIIENEGNDKKITNLFIPRQ